MNNGSVRSVDRALTILELFATDGGELALRDVVRALDLPKSSALMLLRTLVERGYLELIDGTGRYRLNSELQGGQGWIGGAPGQLIRASKEPMNRLWRSLRETVVLATLTANLDVRAVAHLTSPQPVRYDVSGAPVLPTYCTALGRAMLAFLPRHEVISYLERTAMVPMTPRTRTDPALIRRDLDEISVTGIAINIDERFVGASGAAAPVIGQSGRVAGAINVVTVTERFLAQRDRIIDELRDAAVSVTRGLGGEPPDALTSPSMTMPTPLPAARSAS